jgi:cob(I)alamin adenosyltransferase
MGPIYTRGGDSGETSLGDGSRVQKECGRVEAYGCVDELNASLGVLVAAFDGVQDVAAKELVTIQNDLFCIGSHLANPGEASLPAIPVERVNEFEAAIDRMTGSTKPLDGFILPGGCESAARAHVARTVCRRGERRVAALCHSDAATEDDRAALRYLNRLADYLFALARYCNFVEGRPDVRWKP